MQLPANSSPKSPAWLPRMTSLALTLSGNCFTVTFPTHSHELIVTNLFMSLKSLHHFVLQILLVSRFAVPAPTNAVHLEIDSSRSLSLYVCAIDSPRTARVASQHDAVEKRCSSRPCSRRLPGIFVFGVFTSVFEIFLSSCDEMVSSVISVSPRGQGRPLDLPGCISSFHVTSRISCFQAGDESISSCSCFQAWCIHVVFVLAPRSPWCLNCSGAHLSKVSAWTAQMVFRGLRAPCCSSISVLVASTTPPP